MHFLRACGFPGSELRLTSPVVMSDGDCVTVGKEEGGVVVPGGGGGMAVVKGEGGRGKGWLNPLKKSFSLFALSTVSPTALAHGHLSPVAVSGFLHPMFHLLLCCFHGLPFSAHEVSLLLVEDRLDFLCYPWLVIGVTTDSLARETIYAQKFSVSSPL